MSVTYNDCLQTSRHEGAMRAWCSAFYRTNMSHEGIWVSSWEELIWCARNCFSIRLLKMDLVWSGARSGPLRMKTVARPRKDGWERSKLLPLWIFPIPQRLQTIEQTETLCGRQRKLVMVNLSLSVDLVLRLLQ